MKRLSLCLFIVSLAVFGGVKTSPAGEFSADFKEFKSWEEKGEKEKGGKIFVKGKNQRMEFMKGEQIPAIMIFNPSKNASFILNPEEKTYLEMKFAPGDWQQLVEKGEADSNFQKEFLGTERVSGYLCEKIRYLPKDKAVSEGIYWISKKLEYPVKWEISGPEGKSWFLLENIQEGKVSDNLFEVPGGYARVSLGESSPGKGKKGKEEGAANVVKEDAKDIAKDAKDATKQTISDEIGDSIRKGIRGLFGR